MGNGDLNWIANYIWGIADQNAANASRLLKEAVEDEKIVIEDPSVGIRSRTYLPFWANPKVDE